MLPLLLSKVENQNANLNLSEEEALISQSLFEYIDGPQLISLPIPILYRILVAQNITSMKLADQNRIIDFLFKCLDHHKRNASMLFSFFCFCFREVYFLYFLTT